MGFNILPKRNINQQWQDDHCDYDYDYDDSESYEYDEEEEDCEDDDILDEDLEQLVSGSYLEPENICSVDALTV